jgi:hypothetical protein
MMGENPAEAPRGLITEPRAILKATDMCAPEPSRLAQVVVIKGVPTSYDHTLRTLQELPYDAWRTFSPEDTVRFYALRLRKAGLIKSTSQKIHGPGHRLALPHFPHHLDERDECMTQLHNHMPVILDRDLEGAWLDPAITIALPPPRYPSTSPWRKSSANSPRSGRISIHYKSEE